MKCASVSVKRCDEKSIGRARFLEGKRFSVFFLATVAALFLWSVPARGGDLNPAIYLIVDTSGSMLATVDGMHNTYGDGSLEHPHYDPSLISRMFMAKNAVTTIVNAYGEVHWGLARFQQMSGRNYLCMCSDAIPNNTAGCGGYGGLWAPEDECRLCDIMADYPDYDQPGVHDRVCINYGGGLLEGCVDLISGLPLLGADILVPIGPDTNEQILLWVDHEETDPGDPGYDENLPPEEQPNPELRAVGGTPIGGSLFDMYDQLAWEIGSDPRRGCRPYTIILLTDGAEECGTDPITAANDLLTTPDLQRDCSEGCPLNSVCIEGHCRYEVRTHVVAFAVSEQELIGCHQIAMAGNTGAAIPVFSEEGLVSAMAGIIADSIVVELCNGIDDNCNGLTDEDYPDLGMYCDNGLLGECFCSGVMVCSDDQLGTVCAYDPPSETNPCGYPTEEVCDGRDNNCDGLTDNVDPIEYPDGCGPVLDLCDPLFPENEGLDDPRVGQLCGTDIGECEMGVTACVLGEIVCDGEIGPQPEVCDGRDNNCNGLTDEGLARPCYVHREGYPVGCAYDDVTDTWDCTGACRTGIQVCGSGEWGPCMGYVNEKDEVCNNIDDNCSGLTDENLTQVCQVTNAWGTCTGVETCVAGAWVDCDAQIPAEEICDGIDNNCDGITDMITRSCYDYPTGCTFNDVTQTWDCVGQCRAGTQLCAAGEFGPCTGARGPMDEVCNGLDDNCDGTTDLDEFGNPLTETCYTGPPGTEGVGECRAGVRTCTNGVWSGCVGEVTPQQEVCDGRDNDCNGLTDDGLGQTTCGLGECEKTIDNCVNGIPQVCDPFEGATPEVCDRKDNNCDGVTDGLIEVCYTYDTGCVFNDVTQTWDCEGICTTGIRRCPTPEQGGTGVWWPCEYQQGPQPEVCDGRDNNCNGLTDEDEHGNPLSQACYPPGSGPNTGCELDPDTNEWECLGICQAGERLCINGAWDACTGYVTPQAEICDGLDNNCDGQIDEPENLVGLGQPCGSPIGRCTQGIMECIDGQEVCVGGEGPFPGDCNGMDDNCDGVIDDPDEVAHLEGLECGTDVGECEFGETKCVGGEIICVGGRGPAEEVCNGKDDNCNGIIDDGAVCPPNSYCYDGACRPVCDPGDEFSCMPQTDCVNVFIEEESVYICLPTGGDCGGETCPEGWICVNDECVDPCEGVECEPWEECRQGICMDQSCTAFGIDCPPEQICVNHECVDDPCIGAGCDADTEFCVRVCDETECSHECRKLCACPPGERCTPDADCVEDLCHGVSCTGGTRCNHETGECEPDPCFGMTCPFGRVCYEGECIDDPCANVDCPPYYDCVLVDAGGSTPEPQCRVDPVYWNPGTDTMGVFATGKGGCSCRAAGSVSGSSGSSPGWIVLFMMMLVAVGKRSRKLKRRVLDGESGRKVKRGGSEKKAICAAMLLFFTFGCKVDPYEFGEKGGWEIPDASLVDARPPEVDAEIDADIPYCDGADIMNDPYNCGECENVCEFDNAFASCVEGECVMGACLPGYWDLNEDPSDGCEYHCLITNNGVETCDGRDNNCNGLTDEGFDLMNDPRHCGACNKICAFFRAEASCVEGQCVLDYCHSGYVDKDGDPTNGCECMINAPEDPEGAECDPTEQDPCGAEEVCVDRLQDGVHRCSPIPPDLCDGIDTNCNGLTDEDAPEGDPCYTHPSGCSYDEGTDTWTCHGECSTGTRQCIGGIYQCIGQQGPAMEICDGLDNSCNGLTDDGYDFANDPNNCGGCGQTCTVADVPNSVPGCVGGECVIMACLYGFHNIDGEHSTGCEYACVYTNGGVERCDGVDNNCNGIIDDGFDLDTDPNHCGVCNNKCGYPNAMGNCQGGVCSMAECLPGFHNIDGNDSTGCEYACNITNEGIEICDGRDNDCNGITDDGFDTSTDVLNCGNCGHACSDFIPAGAQVAACTDGKCQYSCLPGFHDLNGDLALGTAGDGCEYECTITNGGVEICDGVDNNCNGLTDRTDLGVPLTQSCYTGPDGTENVGICRGGTASCMDGEWGPCVGEVTPEPHEQCDGLDHTCDGDPLSGFDLTTDVLNCGGCGNSCFVSQPDRAYATGCFDSQCQYACEAGFHDLNNDLHDDPTDGCEYECWQTTPPGVEYCDGVDNNCDGDTDTVDFLVPPPPGYCRTDPGTPCEGTEAHCGDGILGRTWYCDYHPDVETDPTNPNRVLVRETLCNGKDGNCDGLVDESFMNKGNPCDDGLLGICRGTGHYECNIEQNGTVCVITNPGEAPQPEVCDGQDNDCDGLTDESFVNPGSDPSYVEDDIVVIDVNGEPVFVYKYEASRPTATAASPGMGTNVRACSRPGVLPWASITHEQARQACMRAGMTLCSDEEWVQACEGEGTSWAYPYHETDYDGAACNTRDAGYGQTMPTGSMPNCATHGYEIEDMSGNVREWTSTIVGYTMEGKAIYGLRGGSFTDTALGARCDFSFTGFVEDAFSSNVGFRCCSRCGNGILDEGEECDWGLEGLDECTRVCGPPTCGDGIVDSPREECDCGTDPNNLPPGCIDINGAPASNCTINCQRPQERCSILYPEDQDGGGEPSNCEDPACEDLYFCLDHTDADGDGWTVAMGDCDDTDPEVYPGAPIICNDGKDNNCNGFIDDDEPDMDGDGYPPCLNGEVYDCDDNNPNVHPGAPEICGDGIDNNCDGLTDENCASDCEIAEYYRSYIGCEYYAASTMNSLLDSGFNNNFGLVVHNPNSEPVNVDISKGGAPVQSASVPADTVQTFLLPYDLTLKNNITSPITVTGGAYHLVSDLPVTVYQFNPFDFRVGSNYSYTNDASLVLPVHVLTENYMVTTRPTFWETMPGFFAIIGTGNNTTVRVDYAGHARNGPNMGTSATYTLDEGDVLQVPSRNCSSGSYAFCSANFDFTGTRIEVTNGSPVAVFAGHNCLYLPATQCCCDHIESQMFPLETWGMNYIATTTAYAPENQYRVLSAVAGNVVTFSPATVHPEVTLGEGGYVDIQTTQNFSVSCTEPCAVTQFLLADNYFGGSIDSDPAMGLLVPIEQYRMNYSFLVPSSMTHNYVSIIKPVGIGAPSVFMDGTAIPESDFGFAIGDSYFGVARVNISSAPYSHTLESTWPFGIQVYGFASYTSYLYPGGLDLNIINVVD